MAWTPPAQFDEYRLDRRLGEGGMGQVWVAHDTALDRTVAIKFIATDLDRDPRARERFAIEARAAARLQHANVVTIYRTGEYDGRPYIVSELIDGTPLSRVDRPMPWARALAIGLGLARGLAAAHKKGVLHRDLKPANAVIASDGTVKLLDFGLAKLIAGGPLPPPPPATFALGSSTALQAPPAPLDIDATQPLGPLGPLAAAAAAAGAPITAAGAIMGTPHYMAPETWRGAGATVAADVYGLGAILYELTTGQPPHAGVAAMELPAVIATADAAPLATVAPGVDARFAAVVDRCLARDPAARPATADELIAALEAIHGTAGPIAGNPYRGLHRFEAEHRAVFCGRATEIGAVVERLRAAPLVVVAGDSGVGKSSLCRAGVLPLALDGGFGDGRVWTAARIVPGQRPMVALRAALDVPALASPDSTAVLGGDAARSGHEQLLRQITTARKHRGLVLLVDQLEELITLADPDERDAAVRLLAELAAGVPGVRVLATARCDFLTRLSGLPELGAAVVRGLYLLQPMTEGGLRAAVLEPARATGVGFDPPALVDQLVRDARGDGALPLLQFTLAELWDARDRERNAITAAVVAQIGGIRGALTRHADRVIAGLVPAQREQARAVLLRLVSAQRTRARCTAAELTRGDADARIALDALVAGRLVVTHADGGDGADGSAGADGDGVHEVAHEALLGEWTTLRAWLDERADVRIAHERLAAAAAEWQRLGRPKDGLLADAALAEVAIVPDGELTADERALVAGSRREQTRRRWRPRLAIAALALAALVGYLAFHEVARRDRARQVARYLDAGRAELDRARAGDAEVATARARAFATFDAGDREGGEAAWAEAQAAAERTLAAYRAAGRAFEAAVTVDNHAARARALLADALYARALAAERDRKDDERDEALARLKLYDDGHRLAAWDAPATVALTTAPAGAAIRVARVEPRAGKAELGPWRDLGATPLAALTLPRGSYVFELTLADHAPTRYPLLLERGEAFTADVPLAPAAQVPAGMIYVPPGRFMVGSTAPDRARRSYLHSAPAHPVTRPGFLGGQAETTLADWVAFLDSFDGAPPPELVPAAGSPGATGYVQLARGATGWRLAMQPATTPYDVELDGTLRYQGRTIDVEQRVARLPVTGISPVAAERYVAWLAATGRIPGAHLCDEWEWERLARGADARAYPHGDQLVAADANYGEDGSDYATYGPDQTGAHPASRSVFGADDMAGNVWEFARSRFRDTPYVVRGGGYPHDEQAASSTMRDGVHDALRDVSIGLRVCATAPTTQR